VLPFWNVDKKKGKAACKNLKKASTNRRTDKVRRPKILSVRCTTGPITRNKSRFGSFQRSTGPNKFRLVDYLVTVNRKESWEPGRLINETIQKSAGVSEPAEVVSIDCRTPTQWPNTTPL
jgi:hypothetical protein